jgi:energy-converting hydrogenase Eha subunit H
MQCKVVFLPVRSKAETKIEIQKMKLRITTMFINDNCLTIRSKHAPRYSTTITCITTEHRTLELQLIFIGETSKELDSKKQRYDQIQ